MCQDVRRFVWTSPTSRVTVLTTVEQTLCHAESARHISQMENQHLLTALATIIQVNEFSLIFFKHYEALLLLNKSEHINSYEKKSKPAWVSYFMGTSLYDYIFV